VTTQFQFIIIIIFVLYYSTKPVKVDTTIRRNEVRLKTRDTHVIKILNNETIITIFTLYFSSE